MLAATALAPSDRITAHCRHSSAWLMYLQLIDTELRFKGYFANVVRACSWPTGNVWEEPWEQASALDTIRKLDRHWHQLKGNQTATLGTAEAAADAVEMGSDDDADDRDQQVPKGVNQVCNHVACSAQPFCLIEQLEVVRSNYHGRADQFRIKVRFKQQFEISANRLLHLPSSPSCLAPYAGVQQYALPGCTVAGGSVLHQPGNHVAASLLLNWPLCKAPG